jgi:hypothetical protein
MIMSIKETIQRIIDLRSERKKIENFKAMSDELKAECIKYYDDEIKRLLNDPYVYDKYYGMQNGGIL